MEAKMRRAEHVSRRLKLRHLNVLLAVAQSGSMAKAAKQLAISQPVVSKAIVELENTLGVRLLDRSQRGVEPTLYGRALIKRSVTILNDLRTSVDELEFLSDPTAGELRIGSSEAVASGMLGAIIDRLSRRHPRVRFEATLGGGLTDLQYRELQAHNIDLIIGRLPRATPEDVETTILYQDQFFFVAGMQNEWVRRRKIAAAELLGEPWCLPSLDVFPWSLIADAFHSRGLALPDTIVTARSVLLQNSLLATGRFLGILPRTVLHFCAKSHQLKILSVDLPIQSYPVGIVTLKNRTLRPVAQVFIDSAIEVAKPFARHN
jgi:DNA-binding transcriptional LysR family regulator